MVEVVPLEESAALARLDPEELAGKDTMKLFVFGGNGQANLVALLGQPRQGRVRRGGPEHGFDVGKVGAEKKTADAEASAAPSKIKPMSVGALPGFAVAHRLADRAALH